MSDYLSQAQTIAHEPVALALLSFVLAFFALCLAVLTPGKLPKSHDSAINRRLAHLRELDKLDGKLAEYEGALAVQARSAGRPTLGPPLIAVSQPPIAAQTMTKSEPPPRELSPLEKKRADLTGFLDDLLLSFEGWANLAGFSLDTAFNVRAEIGALRELVQPPAEQANLDLALDRLPPLITEAVKVILSKTDRDCDPERKNTLLQQHIERFLQHPKLRRTLTMIDPREGDAIDLQEHRTLPSRMGTPQQRGTIARTAVRGFKWSNQVVLKAEVLGYD